MGRAKQKHWLRRPKMPPIPAEVWNVRGVSQHGEVLNFDEKNESAAYQHMDRINRLGGSVCVRRMVWHSPAAAYRVPREGE